MGKSYTITTSEGEILERKFNLIEAAEFILTANGGEFEFYNYAGAWELHTKFTFKSRSKTSWTQMEHLTIIYSTHKTKLEVCKEIAEVVVSCSKNWLGYPTATETEEDDDQGSPAT